MKNNIAILILAAGASNRIGQPKQLLTYNNGTLLSNIIDKCTSCNNADVFVVYGAYRIQLESDLRPYARKVTSFYNDDWQEGMGNSLAFGISQIEQSGSYDAAIVVLADQAKLECTSLTRLMELHEKTGKGIINSYYGEDYGPPTLFSSKYFDKLKSLKGDTGAKPIIRKHVSDSAAFFNPSAKVDIDELEQYYELVNEELVY